MTAGGWVAVVAVTVLFSCFPAVAAELLSGVGPVGRRFTVDLRYSPSNAVAKIQTNIATKFGPTAEGSGDTPPEVERMAANVVEVKRSSTSAVQERGAYGSPNLALNQR
jgi:hypothetical protein